MRTCAGADRPISSRPRFSTWILGLDQQLSRAGMKAIEDVEVGRKAAKYLDGVFQEASEG